MNFDTPFVEYLIIGTHTSTWLLLVVLAAFGIPLSALANVEAGIVLLSLPYIYLTGMFFDSGVQWFLERRRKKIKDDIIESEHERYYKDEFIAFSCPELYSAYEVRVRRVRILGGAIFNWPLVAISLSLHIGFTNRFQPIFVVTSGLILGVLSFWVWCRLYKRAYRFRENACDVIREETSKRELYLMYEVKP